jgi:hypothetical protein
MIPKFDLNFPLETQGKLSNYNMFTLVAPKGNDAYMSLSITNALKGIRYNTKRYGKTEDGRTSVTVITR